MKGRNEGLCQIFCVLGLLDDVMTQFLYTITQNL